MNNNEKSLHREKFPRYIIKWKEEDAEKCELYYPIGETF